MYTVDKKQVGNLKEKKKKRQQNATLNKQQPISDFHVMEIWICKLSQAEYANKKKENWTYFLLLRMDQLLQKNEGTKASDP